MKAMFGDSLEQIWKGIEQIGKSELVAEANSTIQEKIETFKMSSFFEQPEDEPIKKEARAIIHKAATSAAVASGAMAQGSIVSLDTPVLISIHIGMVVAIGALFGKKVSQANAMAILGAAAGVGIGIGVVKSVLGVTPIFGNVVNATVSFSYTEALGWHCFQYFKDTVAANEASNGFNIKAEEFTMGDKSNTFINNALTGAMGDHNHVVDNSFTLFQSEQKQTLKQAAEEIQQLLQQFEDAKPSATDAEKVAYVNKKTTYDFKCRVAGALQASGETAIDEFILENKYLKVAKAAVKGWIKPE